MFLKSLTLKGFKSFADATTLELEPGVTVVVGPNGSGKSNVVDAIAWVLGAQAPSAVRSQKMDDVIFAGTAKRPALGRAEVSLTIDNTARLLDLELTEVTVSRILFRSGESEYAINGVPCRLLDVQELLSDAGVGRQQHVIVSQGQIDAVLNARPEDRRGIIEEAAGVLKYRKRKEKAERRLDATEANLLRVQDLLREVRRQLRPLERQADAARRHGDLVAELTALRVYVSGREISGLRTRLEVLARTRQEADDNERTTKAALAALDTEVISIESELSARGIADLGDRLVRIESLRERARGIAAVLVERRRSVERDRGQLLGEGLIATLEADAAGLRTELATVVAELAALEPELHALDDEEHTLDGDRTHLGDGADEGAERAASAAAEIRGELRSVRQSAERREVDLAQMLARRTELNEALARHDAAIDDYRRECESCRSAEAELIERAERSSIARVAADTERDAAEVQHRTAEAELNRWTVRADTLQQALDAAHSRAGSEHLATLEGALGTLLDLIEIDPGWEDAVAAALGEALGAVVVENPATARRALTLLDESAVGGAVLALGTNAVRPSAPRGGDPVRPHVRTGRPGVAGLLDILIGAAVRVDDQQHAIEIALEHPTAIVVTRRGDRFALSGWRIGASSGAATAAALAEAREGVTTAAAVLERRRHELETARAAADSATAQESMLLRELDAIDTRFARSSEALAAAQIERRDVEHELEQLGLRITEATERLQYLRDRITELEGFLPALQAQEHAEAEVRAALEARAGIIATRRRDLEIRSAALIERRSLAERRLGDIDERLAADQLARQEAAERRQRLETELAVIDGLVEIVAGHRSVIESEHQSLVDQRRRQTETVRSLSTRLDALRAERVDNERRLEESRERARRAEVEHAEATLRLETIVETTRRELDIEPQAAEAAAPPPVAEGVTHAARIRELERELRLMGPINPLALQEYDELQKRHQFLEEQLNDVRTTRRELNQVIRAIDAEIQGVFATAYADVSANFARLFAGLFPGGTGSLTLTSPDDLLNTGIEVEAKPSGKNVKKLSLLSGGERSLTALAFLFAVFRSRPSPFYVMDEVEAALDDVNLHRFLGLVTEFRNEAQLLIVTHQKRTMEAGDSLLGVSMQPGGSSKVITERVSTVNSA